MARDNEDFRVIIVGGGIAGLATVSILFRGIPIVVSRGTNEPRSW